MFGTLLAIHVALILTCASIRPKLTATGLVILVVYMLASSNPSSPQVTRLSPDLAAEARDEEEDGDVDGHASEDGDAIPGNNWAPRRGLKERLESDADEYNLQLAKARSKVEQKGSRPQSSEERRRAMAAMHQDMNARRRDYLS